MFQDERLIKTHQLQRETYSLLTLQKVHQHILPINCFVCLPLTLPFSSGPVLPSNSRPSKTLWTSVVVCWGFAETPTASLMQMTCEIPPQKNAHATICSIHTFRFYRIDVVCRKKRSLAKLTGNLKKKSWNNRRRLEAIMHEGKVCLTHVNRDGNQMGETDDKSSPRGGEKKNTSKLFGYFTSSPPLGIPAGMFSAQRRRRMRL